jgi:TIR domain
MRSETVNIFVCYARDDERWIGDLIQWMQKNLKRFDVEFWWDRSDIQGGDEWRRRVFDAIDRAHFVVLLISDDFASSEFIGKYEVPRIRERKLGVIPILASPVSEAGRETLAWVYELQIVPGDDSPLIRNRGDEAYWHETRAKVQNEISKRVKRLREQRALLPGPEISLAQKGREISMTNRGMAAINISFSPFKDGHRTFSFHPVELLQDGETVTLGIVYGLGSTWVPLQLLPKVQEDLRSSKANFRLGVWYSDLQGRKFVTRYAVTIVPVWTWSFTPQGSERLDSVT